MAIITISRQVGSMGTEIAKTLKADMGFNYLDKEFIEKELVTRYKIPENKIEKYDEKRPSLWDFSSDKDRYIHFMKSIMYDFARQGNSIIVGRGSQFIFRNIPGSMNVRIIAPYSIRSERIMKRFNCDTKMAEKIIKHSDHDRKGFHRYFFNDEWDDQDLYDLTINTKTITVEDAVRIIKDAVESTKIMAMKVDAEGKLKDMCLAQEILTTIEYVQQLGIQFLEVSVTNGVATIKGATAIRENVKKCEEAARKIQGIKDVVNDVLFFQNNLA